jgi:hypothetical protein
MLRLRVRSAPIVAAAIFVPMGLLLVAVLVLASIFVVRLYELHPPASIGDCPSKALVVAPGSQLAQTSQITVGNSTGCWAKYSTDSSAHDVVNYYTTSQNTPGWTVKDFIDSVGEVDLASTTQPGLQGLMQVGSNSIGVSGRRTQFNLSVCFCDPHEFAQ